MTDLLSPKRLEITRQDGKTVAFHFGKFPAIAGREIIAKYPTSNMPKIGDYAVSEETMQKVLGYVAVETASGAVLRLTTPALINEHAGDWQTLMTLELRALEYNSGFFGNGGLSSFLRGSLATLQQSISPMLTGLLEQLLARVQQTAEQPSPSSEPSTR